MDIKDWVAIIVACISVVGAILVAVFQLKRDGKTIDIIHTTTSEMKPQTANIEKNSEQTLKVLSERLTPTLDKIEEKNTDSAKKIDIVYQEIEIQRRLKNENSLGIVNMDRLLSDISSIYAENARLNQIHRADTERITNLTGENERLRLHIKELEQKLPPEEEYEMEM